MRRLIGNVCYAILLFGILASFLFFIRSGGSGADVDACVVAGLACLLFGTGLTVLSQRISPEEGK